MPTKVTQQDIAERAQVDTSSVSLALRGSPRIALETRRYIRAIEEEMGYTPNPLVSALMQSRRRPFCKNSSVIAYVTSLPAATGSDQFNNDPCDYFPGAAKRATELGYRLEHIQLDKSNQTTKPLSLLLSTRGIRGLLIGKLLPGEDALNLQWQKFTCVAIGMTLRIPSLNRVLEDYYTGAADAMEHIYRCGYRKVGFVHSGFDDDPRIVKNWIAAFLVKQLCVQENNRLNPFDIAGASAEHFSTWFATHQPDVLLTTQTGVVLKWLQEIDQPTAANVGLVSLANDRPSARVSGIHCSAAKLGSLGLELLVDSMHRNEFGIPIDPHEVFLKGVWQEGQTCSVRPDKIA